MSEMSDGALNLRDIKILRDTAARQRALSRQSNPYVIGDGSGQVLISNCHRCRGKCKMVLDGVCLECWRREMEDGL